MSLLKKDGLPAPFVGIGCQGDLTDLRCEQDMFKQNFDEHYFLQKNGFPLQ
ncbi:hypothetical protein LLG10_05785 [bacterium]|nr:hypothetical protein [bacterium]